MELKSKPIVQFNAVVHNVRPATSLHVAREDQCESREIDNSVIFFHDVAID